MSVPPEELELGSLPVFRVAAQNTMVIATVECEYPDGLAFSPDARMLYDASTRTRMFVHAFDVHPDGKLDQPPLLCQYVISSGECAGWHEGGCPGARALCGSLNSGRSHVYLEWA
jgi:sugar lactone lactonase YvrE